MAEEALRDLTSLRSNVFGPQPKAPAQPAAQVAQQELVSRIERGQRAEEAIPKLGDMESQATEQKIRAQQAVRTRVAAEQLKQEEAFGGREKSALETRQAGVMAEPEFKPDKMELDDYRNLAGMLIGIGTLVGGKGKMGAMYSLQALNGMMKGYAEGRKDLFKTQQVEFEKALKSVDAHNKRIEREFNDAMSLINTDRRTALAKLKQLEAELGDGVMAADLRLNDLGKLRNDLNSAVKSGENALKMVETNYQKQLDREARAKQTEQDRAERRRHNLMMEALAFRRADISEKKGGKTATSALLAGRAENIREAFAQAAADIVNITKFPPGTMLGALSGLTGSSGDTLIKGIRNSIARQVSPVEQRMLQQLVAGIEGHLAFALGGGYATSQSKARMDQYKEQIARSGDSPENAALFLARLKQEMNILAENFASKPGATEEMNEAVQKYNARIGQAVPFDVDDVIQAALGRSEAKSSESPKPSGGWTVREKK